MVEKQEKIISVDWGSSNLRVICFDLESNTILASIDSDDGVLKFRDLEESERHRNLLHVLEKKIGQLEFDVPGASTLSVYISGMASSNLGIVNIPYFKIPVSNDDHCIYKSEIKTESGKNLNIYSGWTNGHDVMRGEETQALGASKMISGVELFIIPGTHSKHLYFNQGKFLDFTTFMTGEFFDLLSKSSILSVTMTPDHATSFGDAYEDGCKLGYKEPLLHSAFSIRSRFVLDGFSGTDAYAYLSGILIGSELSHIDPAMLQNVCIIGSESLSSLYQRCMLALYGNSTSITMMDAKLATCLGHKLYHQNKL